jgi:hypothetical protein
MPAATKSAMNKVKSPTNCAISGLFLPRVIRSTLQPFGAIGCSPSFPYRNPAVVSLTYASVGSSGAKRQRKGDP